MAERRALIVYVCGRYPLRAAVSDHLYSFRRYSGFRCYYLNLSVGRVPSYIRILPFDVIIFHTTFLACRWDSSSFGRFLRRAALLKDHPARKVMLPQDEFFDSESLVRFIEDFRVDTVFSVAPESEWRKIYQGVRPDVRFEKVLTGYIDDRLVEKVRRLSSRVPARDIDIGYRAWKARPWLGRHGMLKTRIAEAFRPEIVRRLCPGAAIDISMREEDVLLGDRWYEHLLRCRYTIGVEGGASILDRDGSLRKKADDYLRANPEASFEEVEAACFPGADGALSLFALSPRHLEACVTRTCQILVEGDYDGILKPGAHYIELKRDLTNLDDILRSLRDESRREKVAEKAYREIVESGRYSYQRFVEQVLGDIGTLPAGSAGRRLLLAWLSVRERLSGVVVALAGPVWRRVKSWKRRA